MFTPLGIVLSGITTPSDAASSGGKASIWKERKAVSDITLIILISLNASHAAETLRKLRRCVPEAEDYEWHIFKSALGKHQPLLLKQVAALELHVLLHLAVLDVSITGVHRVNYLEQLVWVFVNASIRSLVNLSVPNSWAICLIGSLKYLNTVSGLPLKSSATYSSVIRNEFKKQVLSSLHPYPLQLGQTSKQFRTQSNPLLLQCVASSNRHSK